LPTDIWPTKIWPTDIWLTDIWPTHIWPTHIWPTHIWLTHIWSTTFSQLTFGQHGIWLTDDLVIWSTDIGPNNLWLTVMTCNLANGILDDTIFGKRTMTFSIGQKTFGRPTFGQHGVWLTHDLVIWSTDIGPNNLWLTVVTCNLVNGLLADTIFGYEIRLFHLVKRHLANAMFGRLIIW
jgi:hypothetical protein